MKYQIREREDGHVIWESDDSEQTTKTAAQLVRTNTLACALIYVDGRYAQTMVNLLG